MKVNKIFSFKNILWFASIKESLTKDDTAKFFAEKLSDEGKELMALCIVGFFFCNYSFPEDLSLNLDPILRWTDMTVNPPFSN